VQLSYDLIFFISTVKFKELNVLSLQETGAFLFCGFQFPFFA